ncbi:MAG TPA: hypothetical protein VMR14_04875 [Streptosporangiaceae bacterium]|jgi:hypothetical protein|nr:hypothetical protein [Streptosporangiaceae bacterium]
MVAEFEYESSPRSILAAIVADPDLGPPALSHPATLFSVLRDYLPDSPRETGPLLAAAQLDIPRALRGQVARGVPRPMAIQFAATKLAARTDFSDEACLWAASEFALALGLATADQLPALTPASDLTAVSPAEPGLADEAGSRLPPSEPPGFRPERPRRRRGWLAAIIAGAAVAAAAAIGIAAAALPRHDVAGRHQPHPSASAGPSVRPSASVSPTASASRTAASPSPSVSPSARASAPTADPALVARQYIADVNDRDWPSLWRLGGGNVVLTYQPSPGPLSYTQMVASFDQTVSVTITGLTTTGDAVSMRVDAVDSAGVTQYYELNLVISGGQVVSGSQYFLGP